MNVQLLKIIVLIRKRVESVWHARMDIMLILSSNANKKINFANNILMEFVLGVMRNISYINLFVSLTLLAVLHILAKIVLDANLHTLLRMESVSI